MKALGVVEWHFDQSPSYLLLVINWDAHGLYLFFSRGCTRTHQGTCSLYEGLSPFYDGIFYDVYGYLSFSNCSKPIDSIIGKSLAPYPRIYGRILSNKGCGSLCRFLLSIVVVFTVGHVVRHVNMPLQDWVLAAFLLILVSPSFVAIGLVLTLLPSSPIDVCCGQSPLYGACCHGWLWMPISLFPEWMQKPSANAYQTYQLMELIKTFLNKGQINVLASVYLTLFTLVFFTLVIVYRRHSEVRS